MKRPTSGSKIPLKSRKTLPAGRSRSTMASGGEAVTTGLEDATPSSPAATRAAPPAPAINVTAFRRRLMAWYRSNARRLPWRGISDPYRTWVSEVMLQQTRVAAVLDHYYEFLRRFPTLVALALARESDVLAAWSGLGYYRRARMLHRAAHFIMVERDGMIPSTALELRTLPGIGEYTAAAIASIAFGESIAVVDGNVERVLLRLTGRPNDATAQGNAFVHAQARALVPPRRMTPAPAPRIGDISFARLLQTTLTAHTGDTAGAPGFDSESWVSGREAELDRQPGGPHPRRINAAGDHNQAMMELGATLCLPRNPLCLQCPVYDLCLTRGEHITPARPPQRSRSIAYLLNLRKRGPVTEVLLERRPDHASLMPGMYELPPLPLDAVVGREPVLRIRHAITNTNYYVQIFAPLTREPENLFPIKPVTREAAADARALRRSIPAAAEDLHWVRISRLPGIPLTGLTRKVLQRLDVMEIPHMNILD